jgi:hypothetical protein
VVLWYYKRHGKMFEYKVQSDLLRDIEDFCWEVELLDVKARAIRDTMRPLGVRLIETTETWYMVNNWVKRTFEGCDIQYSGSGERDGENRDVISTIWWVRYGYNKVKVAVSLYPMEQRKEPESGMVMNVGISIDGEYGAVTDCSVGEMSRETRDGLEQMLGDWWGGH